MLLSIDGYCGYTHGGVFSNIRNAGDGQISFNCPPAIVNCFRSAGTGTTVKPGDIVEVYIGGSWYCCLEIMSVPPDTKGNSGGTGFNGIIEDGSPLQDIVGQ
jgi:hypothetical protein